MDLEKLVSYQEELAEKVTLVDNFERLDRIGGVDVAYSGNHAYGAAVVLDYKSMEILETKTSRTVVSFPYIPTFLSFREAEPMTAALRGLEKGFDILLVNGHGIAHPRGIGIASHLGVELGIPTIGVARGLLCGEVIENNIMFKGRDVGFKIGVRGDKPLFISPGNMVSLPSSLKIVLACMRGHGLPEPLWAAHNAASAARDSG
jgi:deoxyribonuclease V